MKHLSAIVAVAIIASFLGNQHALAQEDTCVDKASNNLEVDKCGDQIVPPLEARIDREYARLSEKYKDNEEMLVLLKLTKQSWTNYRNIFCNFEGAAAAGGQTKGVLPVDANKEYLKCVIHTLKDMASELGKY